MTESMMIHMTCPQCGAELELDPGFAGGVARCSHCAALMTVPAGAADAGPRLLSRDERPEVEPPVATAVQRVRRPVVRVVTGLSIAAAMVLLVAAFGAVVWLMVTSPSQAERDAAVVARMHEAMQADPFAAESFSALGIALVPPAVVIVDADYRSEPWISRVNTALLHGLTRTPHSGDANLIFTAEPAPRALVGVPVNPTQLDRATIESFLAGIATDGTPSLDAAVRLGLQSRPRHVVLVIGRTLSSDEHAALRDAVQEAGTPRLDVVMIDKDDPELDALAVSTGGVYVPLSQRMMAENWSN